MKKVLVAINNNNLLEQIKKCGKYMVHSYDINTMEDVLEYINKYDVDVLITKDTLNGNITKEQYIKGIKNVEKSIKVILCVEKLDEVYKGFLLSNNVFDIIEGNEVKFTDVIQMIDSVEKIIILKQNKNIESDFIRNSSDVNVMTKKKICIFGTSGAGKSYIASLLAQITSRKFKLNTLLVDMDIQNAAVDIYNNLSSSGNNLQYVMEEIDRGSFTSEVLQDIISKERRKNGKLSFITNNMGIYECQNKLSEEYYSRLYAETERKYDILILDMPATPFLDVVPYSLTKADKIFFVINPNFISIRQAIKYLDLLTNIWKIDKENILIIVNKIKKESLSIKQIEAILRDYKICLQIVEDNKVEGIINGLGEINMNVVEKVNNFSKIFDVIVDNQGVNEMETIESYDS